MLIDRAIVAALFVACAVGSFATLARATAPPPEQLSITLPSSAFMDLGDPASMDRDKDGLKDDYENMLADAWRPYFAFDEDETDVRSYEPRTLFQLRPTSWARPITAVIKWAFLFARDGGYPGACTDAHDGDTQSGSATLETMDGKTWTLTKLNLWNHKHYIGPDLSLPGNSPFGTGLISVNPNSPFWKSENWVSAAPASLASLKWKAPRSTYWSQLPDKPSPIIYVSEGKHHQYATGGICEDAGSSNIIGTIMSGDCEEDCGGGKQRVADLTPLGSFNNVGEPNAHPTGAAANSPFVTDLAPLGYKNEQVWYANWVCKCNGSGKECFTGGKGLGWSTSSTKCTQPSPVYKLFEAGDPPPQAIRTRVRMIALSLM